MKLNKIVIALGFIGMLLTPAVYAQDVAFEFKGFKAMVPLKVVNAIQLYSFDEGKGYPAVETVLVEKKNFRLNLGAASVLGTSENVPFVSLETRLSDKFFDISNNDLYFGAWVGKQSDQKDGTWGLAASIQLW